MDVMVGVVALEVDGVRAVETWLPHSARARCAACHCPCAST